MRKIINLHPAENYLINIQFDNGVQKVFDLKPYLHLPVFAALKKEEQFLSVINKGEIPNQHLDSTSD